MGLFKLVTTVTKLVYLLTSFVNSRRLSELFLIVWHALYRVRKCRVQSVKVPLAEHHMSLPHVPPIPCWKTLTS